MTEDTEPQEMVEEEVVENPEVDQPEPVEGQVEEHEEESTQVPLSALQKERKRRQEAEVKAQRNEIELQYLKEQAVKRNEPEEEETDLYEPTTKAELKEYTAKSIASAARAEREESWIENNAEKASFVDANLANFLKNRPNWVSAIQSSKNRYKEAYDLMTALSPREQKSIVKQKVAPKVAPNSPAGVPKGAAMDQAVDVMEMTDDEFRQWRQSKRRAAR